MRKKHIKKNKKIDKIFIEEAGKELEKLYNKKHNEFMFGSLQINSSKISSSEKFLDEWAKWLKSKFKKTN